jgi:hypothetical protein
VEGLHPVTLEKEVAIDVKVARVIAIDLNAECILNVLLIQPAADPAKLLIAEIAGVLALATNIIDILAGALVGANECIVAVDRRRHTLPNAATGVAAINKREAARQSIVHGSTVGFAENGRPSTITTGHRPIVFVLGEAVSKAVADEDRLKIDVALLMRQNLGGEDRNVVAGIRFAGNVKVLLSVLGKLLEEQREQSIDIFSSSDSVAD